MFNYNKNSALYWISCTAGASASGLDFLLGGPDATSILTMGSALVWVMLSTHGTTGSHVQVATSFVAEWLRNCNVRLAHWGSQRGILTVDKPTLK